MAGTWKHSIRVPTGCLLGGYGVRPPLETTKYLPVLKTGSKVFSPKAPGRFHVMSAMKPTAGILTHNHTTGWSTSDLKPQ